MWNRGWICLVFILFATTVFAEEREVIRFKETVVKASPYPNPVTPVTSHYATQHNVVTEEQIRQQHSLDFQSTLQDVPGVMFQSKNLMGSQTSHSMYIRGRGASHPSSDFSIQFDGAPRYGALFGQVLGDGISVATIGGIEIFKSPQPSEFGSGYALVNVQPKYMKEEGREVIFSSSGGSYATFVQSLSGGVKRGAYDGYAVQNWSSTNGDRAHSRAQQQSYYANAGYGLNHQWNIRFLANYVLSQTLAPGPETAPAATNGVVWPMAERFDTETFFSTLTLNNRYEHFSGYLKVYINDTNFDLRQELNNGVRYAGNTGGLWSRQDVLLYGIRVKEKLRFGVNGEILVGADMDKTELKNTERTYSGFATPGINGGLAERVWDYPGTSLLSPYVAISRMFGRPDSFHAIPSAGYRYYHSSQFSAASGGQVGLVVGYRYTDLHIQYSRGVNYPTPVLLMNAVLTSAPKTVTADIKPEIVDHYEIGLMHDWRGKGSVGASFFYDKGSDRFLAYMNGPVPVAFNDPVGKYEIRGLELNGTYKPFKLFNLFAGATLMDARATGNDHIERDHMPYTPGFQLQAGANWIFLDGIHLRVDMQYLQDVYDGTVSRRGANSFQYAGLTDKNKLEDFVLVNGRLSYRFDYQPLNLMDSEVFVALNNIFNRHYEYAKGYPMPGATLFAGLSVKFRQ